MKRLLKGADILAWEKDAFTCIRNGYLGIDGDRIDYVGAEPPRGASDETKDMTHPPLRPGLLWARGRNLTGELRWHPSTR